METGSLIDPSSCYTPLAFVSRFARRVRAHWDEHQFRYHLCQDDERCVDLHYLTAYLLPVVNLSQEWLLSDLELPPLDWLLLVDTDTRPAGQEEGPSFLKPLLPHFDEFSPFSAIITAVSEKAELVLLNEFEYEPTGYIFTTIGSVDLAVGDALMNGTFVGNDAVDLSVLAKQRR